MNKICWKWKFTKIRDLLGNRRWSLPCLIWEMLQVLACSS